MDKSQEPFLFLILSFLILVNEPRTSCLLSKHSTTELLFWNWVSPSYSGWLWTHFISPGSPEFCCLLVSSSQVAVATGLHDWSGPLLFFPELRLEQRDLTFGGKTTYQTAPEEDLWESISGTMDLGHGLGTRPMALRMVESCYSSVTDSAAPASSIKPEPRGSCKWQQVIIIHTQKEGILLSFCFIPCRRGGHKCLELEGSGGHSYAVEILWVLLRRGKLHGWGQAAGIVQYLQK